MTQVRFLYKYLKFYKYYGLGTHFCTAVDSLRDKLVGCSRLVEIKNVPMCRPSTRVPFGVYCESHKQRLIRHNCCPTCGVFCTEVRIMSFLILIIFLNQKPVLRVGSCKSRS